MEENTLDFNFWPSFADLMLTLVLILVIVVFVVIVVLSAGTVDLSDVVNKQQDIINAIAAEYGVEPKENKEGTFVIPIHLEDGGYTEIMIQNEPTLQRYSFNDRILFQPNEYDLNEDGEKTLLIVGNQIKRNLDSISEIQIQGHADPDRPSLYTSNLHLAAFRAIEVYKFLQEKIHINPATHLMSATSFGEYKPIQRSNRDSSYSSEKLKEHNRTKKLKAQNRRMEILLFYRFEQTD